MKANPVVLFEFFIFHFIERLGNLTEYTRFGWPIVQLSG